MNLLGRAAAKSFEAGLVRLLSLSPQPIRAKC